MIRKEKVYVSCFLKHDEEGRPIYGKPELHYLKFNTPTGYIDIQSYVDKVTKMRKALVDYQERYSFHEKDLAYIGVTPDSEEYNGQKANYIVDAVLPQHLKAVVMFREL